jgi:hypothetical protein
MCNLHCGTVRSATLNPGFGHKETLIRCRWLTNVPFLAAMQNYLTEPLSAQSMAVSGMAQVSLVSAFEIYKRNLATFMQHGDGML